MMKSKSPADTTFKNVKARMLYVADCLPLAIVAAKLGVTERTAQRWKAVAAKGGDDWDKARTAGRLGRESIKGAAQESLAAFLEYHKEALESLKSNTELDIQARVSAITNLADAYTKHLRAAAITAPSLNALAIASDVLSRLTAFVKANHAEAAPVLAAVLEAFGPELVKAYEYE